MKAMPLTRYFEIKNPIYETLQIIPHSGDRNYNSSSIAKMVADMYRSITKSIKRIEKKLIIETAVKCSYMIDIRKDSVNFYFVVPKQYKYIAKTKIADVWPHATIQENETIEPFHHSNMNSYQLAYRKLDGLSLAVDKKSNNSLNHILDVIDIMQEEDRVAVMYNFIPTSQANWGNRCRQDITKYEMNEPVIKEFGAEHVWKGILNIVCTIIDSVLDGLGSELTKGSPLDQLSQYIKNNKAELSEATKRKRYDTVIDTQIVVVSGSNDRERCSNNAVSVCQSYRALEGDNELTYKKVPSKNISLLDTKFKGVETIKTSASECHNFLQLPGRELLQQHKIDHVNVMEVKVVEELRNGYISTGKTTYKGNTINTYVSLKKEIGCLPFVRVGPMGCGKTFENLMDATEAIKAGDGVIVIDYIKHNEFADSVKAVTPKDRLIEIDMSNEDHLQAFCYNEFKVTGDTPKDRMKCANKKQQAITELVDAVYMGEPLSGQMRKFFTSACNVVLTQGMASLKDVMDCLEDYEARKKFIENIPSDLEQYLIDQVKTLQQLDDIRVVKSKVKDDNGKDIVVETQIGDTRYSKIEHIVDRINIMKETLEMQLMYEKTPTNNIDFAKAMNEGKVIIIKMNSDDFGSEHIRNILVTFFVSKIWLACNVRGSQIEPKKCHVYLDEIFQAPTAYEPLRKILKQCRKFRLRLVFTAQMLGDLKELNDGLKSAGASYQLMQKADKSNFEYLNREFANYGFELGDLLNLKLHHALNLIAHSGGYCAYEADLEVK